MAVDPRTLPGMSVVLSADGDRAPGNITQFPPISLESVGPSSEEEDDYRPEIFERIEEGPALEALAGWAKDRASPCYNHLLAEGTEKVECAESFELGRAEIELLIAANRYKPVGALDTIAFGLRGATLRDDEKYEQVDRLPLKDARPNHVNYCCVIGFYFHNTRKFSAYTASTVPWHGYMAGNPNKFNILPTGCYIYKKGAHCPKDRSRWVEPALRLSDANGSQSGETTVLRTFDDQMFDLTDRWTVSEPSDNIHCGYSSSKFSSAGCQVVKGGMHDGLWADFQRTLVNLPSNARVDYLLYTGAEASIAAALVKAGKGAGDPAVEQALGRLRAGSEGESVNALQAVLGIAPPTGYFGAKMKKLLTEFQRAKGIPADGIYSPAMEAKLGLSILSAKAVTPPQQPRQPPPVEPKTSAFVPAAGGTRGTATVSAHAPPQATAATPAPADQSAVASVFQTTAIAAATAAVAARGTTTADPAVVSVYQPPIPIPGASLRPKEPASAQFDPSIAVPSAYQPKPVAPATAPQPAPTGQPAAGGRKPAILLTMETLARFAPKANSDYAAALVEQGNHILSQYGINANSRRFCHFMAQVAHESGGFTIREENLSYSAKRMTEVWPGRYPTIAAAAPYAKNPEALANHTYGGRMGNNRTGDGWRYRGRGLMQVTGKNEYRRIGKLIGVDLEGNPDLALDGIVAVKAAAAIFMDYGCCALADKDDIRGITKRINGGYTGLADREKRYAAARGVWQAGPGLESLGEPELEGTPESAEPAGDPAAWQSIRRRGRALWMLGLILFLASLAILALRALEGSLAIPEDFGDLVAIGFPLLALIVSIASMVLGSGIARASRHASAALEAIGDRFDGPIRAGPNLDDD